MAKFSFELENILEFRSFEQSNAEAELAKALAAENQIQQNLNLLAQQKVAEKQASGGATDLQTIVNRERFFSLVKQQTEQLLEMLTQAKMVSDEKRAVLAECMKKTKALEKLREKKLAEFKEQEDYLDAEFMDELATTRAKL